MFEFIKNLMGSDKEPVIKKEMPRQRHSPAPALRKKTEPVIGPCDMGPMVTIKTPVPQTISKEFGALKDGISKGRKLESFSHGKQQLSEEFKIFAGSYGAFIFNDAIWVATGQSITEYTIDDGTLLRSFDLPDICPPDFNAISYYAVAALSSEEILFVLFGFYEGEEHHQYPVEHRRYRSFPVVFHPQSDKGPFTIFPDEKSLHTVTFKTFSGTEPGQYIVVEDVDYSSHFSNDFQSRKTMTLLDIHTGTLTEVKGPEPGEDCPFFSATSMYEKYNWDTRNVEWKFQSKSGLGRCKIHIGDPGQVTGTLNPPAAFIPDNSPNKFEKPWIKSSRLNNHLLETDLLGDDVITVRYWNIERSLEDQSK